MDLPSLLAYARSARGRQHVRWLLLGTGGLMGLQWVRQRRQQRLQTKAGLTKSESYKTLSLASSDPDSSKRARARKLNQKFLDELYWLLGLMVPGVWCRETAVLLLHSGTLVCRTFLSIYVAYLEGRIVKCIVQKDVRSFGAELARWLLVALPATFINSMIKYFESLLGLMFRTRLVDKAYREYFDAETYYRVGNMDSRLPNADQCLTEDISKFTDGVARLYSDLTKPIFDLILLSITMISASHKRGTASPEGLGIFGGVVLLLTARILRLVSPNFGQIVAEEANRAGQLRYVHSRVITNSEEIAFYGGHKVEHSQLRQAFERLAAQMHVLYRKRILYIMMEQFLMKYVWSGTGMIMIAVPILTAQYADDERTQTMDEQADGGASERTRGFTTAKNLLLGAADAAERLMSTVKKLNELAGYTSRVTEMFRVFAAMRRQEYVRGGGLAEVSLDGETVASRTRYDISQVHGEVVDVHGYITMEDVPIVTPTGDVVVESMTIEIRAGEHLLVTGPNGCGKSSLFRVLGGLWPVYRGRVEKPAPEQMYYVPQRPYMTLGTLRDQVIYPDTKEDMLAKNLDDAYLHTILTTTHLTHIVEREGGWDARSDWMDVLSGGEKQRLGLARVFYHRPEFVLLDECTSAVSIDVEGSIYQAVKAHGITLITITHRPSLWQFHTHLLQFDGEGGYRLRRLEDPSVDNRILSLSDEKQRLVKQLGEMDNIRQRLHSVNRVNRPWVGQRGSKKTYTP